LEATTSNESKSLKRAEYRQEVEALVRRVVPEEIDNVDEMMNQFKGREEELIETLRTMQERAVAQKARAAGQRSAKMEARKTAASNRAAGGAAGIAAAVGITAAGAAVVASDRSKDEASKETAESVAEKRTALEMAIEAGDWEAVGEAAAMMSDASVSTAGTGTTGSSKRLRTLTGVNAERAAELDAMIERGDWSGVVAAADAFAKDDRKHASKGVRSKEEEEALKEAELWMKIAEQKKAEGATDAGAEDAAEWAIQQSLRQLREAEKKKRGDEANEEDEV
jgi:hypothetical protein